MSDLTTNDNCQNRLRLSIILPCYNEQGNVRSMVDALMELDLEASYEIEIVFVDDGSTDGTWAEIEEMSRKFESVKGARFSRNFGHQAALWAGINLACGDAVITMDADLQHPPPLIPRMIACWRQGAEVVTTTRRDSSDAGVFKRVSSRVFYKLFRAITGLPIVPGQADFRLLDRKVVNELRAFRESEIFLRGLVSWIGFKQENLDYEPDQRQTGQTKYSLKRMLKLALNSAFSFSNVPLRVGLIFGIVITGFCFAYGTYAIAVRLFFAHYFEKLVPGWASLATLISFLFGLMFVQIGLLGEYLARVYMESKGRPRYVVSETV